MRFAEATKEAFSFLEGAGFRLTESDPVRVRYESRRAFVTIDWERPSGELNVFLGLHPRKGEESEAFSLSDLLSMQNVDVPERKMPFQVAEEGKLKPFIDKLADDTRSHAQPALTGDRIFFRRLSAYRHAQAQAFVRDLSLRNIRTEVEKAWRERELDTVIDLYSSIEDQLTASERAKLAYAKRHQRR
jgi:hypothetical protein